ncbi:hypothetical protein TWF718_007786 [Orbilia javanica]|uniref:Uncharacterized protein n=1 Tax=Orbilia javanica TaxID=47235 RepID=A0AAN8RH53_9PEZI
MTMSALSNSSLAAMARSYDVELDAAHELSDERYELDLDTALNPKEAMDHDSITHAHPPASIIELAALAHPGQEAATDELVADITAFLRGRVGRYTRGDRDPGPWTVLSFQALEGGIQNDVGLELDYGWDYEIVACPDSDSDDRIEDYFDDLAA